MSASKRKGGRSSRLLRICREGSADSSRACVARASSHSSCCASGLIAWIGEDASASAGECRRAEEKGPADTLAAVAGAEAGARVDRDGGGDGCCCCCCCAVDAAACDDMALCGSDDRRRRQWRAQAGNSGRWSAVYRARWCRASFPSLLAPSCRCVALLLACQTQKRQARPSVSRSERRASVLLTACTPHGSTHCDRWMTRRRCAPRSHHAEQKQKQRPQQSTEQTSHGRAATHARALPRQTSHSSAPPSPCSLTQTRRNHRLSLVAAFANPPFEPPPR